MENMTLIVNNAIAWAEAHLGSKAYNGMCLSFIEDAVEESNHLELWGGSSAAESASLYHAEEHTGVPDKGAFVFYRCSGMADGEKVDWGHCGLCIGDGRIIHAYGEVRVDDYLAVEKLTPPPTWEPNAYIGWAPLETVLAYRDE